MLFSQFSHTPQPSIYFLLLQTFRAFKDESSYIKSFWIEGWGNRNIDDDKYAKMPIFSYLEDKTNVYACCSFKLIINNECLVYIHSSDFALIIYGTKITGRQFHVSHF